MSHELYKKYRPKTLDEVVGQDSAVKVLRSCLKAGEIPHTILFSGPSGCGKTTLARILAREMGCKGVNLQDVNCATLEEPLKVVRAIQNHMHSVPADKGTCRIWILEESQSLARAGFTMQALLQALEDTPRHVYFSLCTTNPNKLLPAILNRCKKIVVKPLSKGDMTLLLERISKAEKRTLDKGVLDKIIDVAGGSPREAVNQLDTVFKLKTPEEQLEAVQPVEVSRDAINVFRALINPYAKWPDVAKVLREIELDDSSAEGLRRLVLACANKTLLKGGKGAERAYRIIYCFEGDFFNSGKSGLLRAAWEVIHDV